MRAISFFIFSALLVGATSHVFAQTQPNYEAQVLAAKPDVSLDFSDTIGGFRDSVSGLVFAPSSAGTVLYGQPSTLPGRSAASLTYDAYLTAPNTSLDNFDWTQPWWAIVDIKPQVTRAGYTRVELFSKGVPNPNLSIADPTGVGYEGFLDWNGNNVVACLNLTSATPAGGPSGISRCSDLDVPNGYAMTIAFTYDGSGTAGGIGIYVNGEQTLEAPRTVGTPTASSMATPGYPLYVNGDATNDVALQGANVHNNAPTLFQAFAMGGGILGAATIESLAVHDRFYAQVLAPPPAVPATIVWDNDGCEDSDNLNSLAAAIRLTQLGYLKIALVNNTDWSDEGAAIFRQMLDQAGLHHVPVSSSQGTWTTSVLPGENICQPAYLAAYNATYLKRAQQMSDVAGYRTVLAAASDASVQIVVGGALRGVYDLLLSPPDAISPLTGAQLFAAKVTAIHMQSAINQGGDNNLGEDVAGATYVLANAGVPIYFYGSGVSFGETGPGANVTRIQQYPFVATLVHVNALTRPSWDMWPLLGAVDQGLFWNSGPPGTVTLYGSAGGSTFSTAKDSQHYVVVGTQPWSDPNETAMGSWLLNSLINANPEPPIVP